MSYILVEEILYDPRKLQTWSGGTNIVPGLLLVQRHGIGRDGRRHLLAVLDEALQQQLFQHLLLLRHGEEYSGVRGQLLPKVLDAVRELVDGLDALGEDGNGEGTGRAREAPGRERGGADVGEVHQRVDLAAGLIGEDLQLVEVGAGRQGPGSERRLVIRSHSFLSPEGKHTVC